MAISGPTMAREEYLQHIFPVLYSCIWDWRFPTCTNPIIIQFFNHPPPPPKKVCIVIVCNFSWDIKMSQGKSKTMPRQFFFFWGGEGKRGVLWDCTSREFPLTPSLQTNKQRSCNEVNSCVLILALESLHSTRQMRCRREIIPRLTTLYKTNSVQKRDHTFQLGGGCSRKCIKRPAWRMEYLRAIQLP